jgi:hypothetical protein
MAGGGIHLVEVPATVQEMAEEYRAFHRASLESALEGIPDRDLDRLRQQLTPYAKRVCTPEDQRQIAKFIHEWNMRGLPQAAPPVLWELLREDHRIEREARAATVRPYYEKLFAPWFQAEETPHNPTQLRIVRLTDGSLSPGSILKRLRAVLHL